MAVMEAKAKWELARASSIWLHAGGAVGLVLSVELVWVEVLGILGWGGTGKDWFLSVGRIGILG